MKSRRALTASILITIILIAGAAALAAENSAPVQLKLRFNKGDVYNYSFKIDGAANFSMTAPPEMKDTMGEDSFDQPLDISFYFENEIKVAAVDKATGAATLSVQLTTFKAKEGTNYIFNSESERQQIDDFTQELLDKPMNVKIGADGKLLAVDFPQAKILEKDMKEVFPDFKIADAIKELWVSLPEKPVAPGDKWTTPINIEIPWEKKNNKIKLDIEFSHDGFETVKGINCAVIGLKFTGDFKDQFKNIKFPPGDKNFMNIAITKNTLSLDGKIYFAPKAGVLMGGHIDASIGLAGSISDNSSDDTPALPFKVDADLALEAELQ